MLVSCVYGGSVCSEEDVVSLSKAWLNIKIF